VEGTDLSRIVAFTDGVFAIAITLLVLNLDAPDLPDADLWGVIGDLSPDLFAYFLSFAVIGRYWIVHHRVFAEVQSFDGRLLALNLFYLAFIVLVPFTTEVLGNHGDTTEGVVLYAFVLGVAASFNWLMIRHIVVRGHVRDEARLATSRFSDRSALALPAVFFLSIPVAFVSPRGAAVLWAALLVIHPGLRRHQRPDERRQPSRS
jgi:uncharacterized membrane protein